MNLSKNNLEIFQLGNEKAFNTSLSYLKINSDGSTISAANGCFIAVSGLPKEIQKNFIVYTDDNPESFNLLKTDAKDILKNISGEKISDLLSQVAIKEENENTIKFITTDGKKEIYQTVKINRNNFELEKIDNINSMTVCINRKNFSNILNIFNKICSDLSGNSPLFLTVCKYGITLKGLNLKTKQVIIAYISNYDVQNMNIEKSEWEKSFYKKQLLRRK